MIFELKNKMPRYSPFLRSEDVLTSNVFGHLRYFSNQFILIDFLNMSIDINKEPLNIEKNNIFNIEFWKKHYNDEEKRYNETDIMLKNNKYQIIH